MRSPSRTPEMSSTQSTSFMNLDECLPKIPPTLQPPPEYKDNAENVGKLSKPKKRSSTGRDLCVPRITPSSLHSDSITDATDNQTDVSTSSPPMKYDRTEESPVGPGHISRSERRTQSVRTKS
ncbi:hypothetical protein GCK32_015210, partial [Trichostrongylus colubriformis]